MGRTGEQYHIGELGELLLESLPRMLPLVQSLVVDVGLVFFWLGIHVISLLDSGALTLICSEDM